MKIGPYEVLSEVGRGGMGVVYRARSADGREVAVKLLLDAKPERRARFERERRLLASLGEADGFVPFFDAGESPRGPYVVMPFVAGGTLRERLARGPLAVDEAVALGAALAKSCGLAHEKGIVHRDLKPENILFTHRGAESTHHALIADLGLAKHFDRRTLGASQSASVSAAGLGAGTLGYMAPEQMNDSKSVGPRADVFALGTIIYECLAGQPAFEGDTALEVAHKVAGNVVAPLGRLRPDAPRWLAHAVHRCLASDPARRFADGHQLARALAGPSLDGHRRAALLAAGAGLLLAIGLGAAYAVRRAPPPPPPPAPPAREPTVEELVERADEKMQRHDYAGSIADASLAIARDPRCSMAWAVRGIARSMTDRTSGILDLSKAIAVDPKNSRAWYVRGIIERNSGELAPAIEDLGKATELSPRWPAPWIALGIARKERGDHDAAIADFTRALGLEPNNPSAWLERGNTRQLKGDHKAALPDFTRAIDLDPKYALPWTYRANAKIFLGDYKGAIEDCTEAVARDPRQLKAWADRALAKVATDDDDGAIPDCDRAIELAPRYAVVWDTRGTAKLKKGDSSGAIDDFLKAIELDPQFAQAFGNLGSALLAAGDETGAIQRYERFLELEPGGPNSGRVRKQVERLKMNRR